MAIPNEVVDVVKRIHLSPTRGVVCVTGGAAQAVSWLLAVPGASGTVLEALVPYSRFSLFDFLGHETESFASAETVAEMAVAAYRRAAALAEPGPPIIGAAASCALASDKPKRGEHRYRGGTFVCPLRETLIR